jgi:hypothetical protein
MTFRLLTVLLFLSPNAQALAEKRYDYPDNSQSSPSAFSSYKKTYPPDIRYGPGSGRYTLWSDYKGFKNNKRSISPNRWVWEGLLVACKAKPNGERAYFYVAVDATTGFYLTSPVLQYSTQIKPLDCW